MKKFTLIIIALGLILSLQCCASADKKPFEPEGVLLGQSELEELFSNKITFDAQLKNVTVEVTCFPNGTQKSTWEEGDMGTNSDSGTYRLINGKKCNKWKKAYGGMEKCLIYYKMSENKYCVVEDDGSFHAYITIK